MTRDEHFARARRWGIASGACVAVAVIAMLAGRATHSGLPSLVGVLAFLGIGITAVSAGYRLLMGLSRPADWRPLDGEPLDRFDPEDEERLLRARIEREIGARLIGDVEVEHENIVGAYPNDDRSAWQKFLQSSEPMFPRYRFTCSIPTDARALVLSVWIGRSETDASFSRMRILLESECRAKPSAPVSWRDELEGSKNDVAALRSDSELVVLLSGLVRRRVRSGGRWVVHPDPHFSVTPDSAGTARATLDTVEQDWKGGFVLKLGLDGFSTAVDRIEKLLDERR